MNNRKSKELINYIDAAMSKATIKHFEDGTFFGEISECPGVWSNEDTKEECLKILREVLEEWIILKLADGDSLPVIDGKSI